MSFFVRAFAIRGKEQFNWLPALDLRNARIAATLMAFTHG